jgi:hypothetical protein
MAVLFVRLPADAIACGCSLSFKSIREQARRARMEDGFDDPRIALTYDALSSPDAGMRFYLALAGTTTRRILDIGCGTGVLACAFSERGHVVTIVPRQCSTSHAYGPERSGSHG